MTVWRPPVAALDMTEMPISTQNGPKPNSLPEPPKNQTENQNQNSENNDRAACNQLMNFIRFLTNAKNTQNHGK